MGGGGSKKTKEKGKEPSNVEAKESKGTSLEDAAKLAREDLVQQVESGKTKEGEHGGFPLFTQEEKTDRIWAGECETQGWRKSMERKRIHDHMQDATVMMGSFRENEGLYCVFDGGCGGFLSQMWEILGVITGHGGPKASAYAAEHLPDIFRKYLKDPSYGKNAEGLNIDLALTKTFEETNACMEDFAKMFGTTALIVHVREEELVVANVGDTRAVLSSKKGVQRISHDHKATDPEEKARITKDGGVVDGSGRVLGMLCVARALGDAEFGPIISSEPFVGHAVWSKGDFAVLACDGVWDVFSDEDVVALVAKLLSEEKSPKDAAKAVVQSALDKESKDNVTCMVVVKL